VVSQALYIKQGPSGFHTHSAKISVPEIFLDYLVYQEITVWITTLTHLRIVVLAVRQLGYVQFYTEINMEVNTN
jgi:hypothetical protein